jgi:hypothetical protein
MISRASFLSLALLAGCTTAATAPPPGGAPSGPTAPAAVATPGAAPAAGPSDWALAIVGTPFVFAFRVVTCAATAVVAAPTAGLLALSEEYRPALAYLRDGLAQNCGPPYAVSVPVASSYGHAPYEPEPRPLVRYDPKLATAGPVAAIPTPED